MPTKRCKCGAEIRFEKNDETGKWAVLSVATGLSHFLDCPNANEFSGRNKKKASDG